MLNLDFMRVNVLFLNSSCARPYLMSHAFLYVYLQYVNQTVLSRVSEEMDDTSLRRLLNRHVLACLFFLYVYLQLCEPVSP